MIPATPRNIAPVSPPVGEELPVVPRRRPWWRLLLGCLIVVLCGAGIGATAALEQVHGLRDALNANVPLTIGSGALAGAGWGDPQTLLLVGDDQRSLTGQFKYYSRAVLPHSNEMLLVRIDPAKPYISMMSIPRELETTIYPPGRPPVTTRFNYAYTAGGISLLVSTIKRVLGLPVNHVMVVTFARFERAVNEMGCVYSTVDRRYFHVNVPGGEQYQEVNLQPGYQNMCGSQALQFVSYRHGDTSLVRDARDQSLLLDVKKEYGSTLADNVGKFERIFGQAVQTDQGLHSTSGLLNLIGTLISSSGRRVRQVQFQVNLVPPASTPCSCVTATRQQITSSVHAFLYGGSPIPKRPTAPAGPGRGGRHPGLGLPALTAVAPATRAAAVVAARGVPFPYEFPRIQDRGGSPTPAAFRNYLIHGPDHVAHPIYVAVFSAGQLGQYYDVQGTTWSGVPLLRSPQQAVRLGGRTYDLYYSGGHLQLVAWADRSAVYWIRNTLTNVLPGNEMLGLAEQTAQVAPVRTLPSGTPGSPAAYVPVPGSHASPTSTRQLLGGLAALLTLVGMPILGLLTVRRRRELAAVGDGLQLSGQRVGRLGAVLSRMSRPARARRSSPPERRSHPLRSPGPPS